MINRIAWSFDQALGKSRSGVLIYAPGREDSLMNMPVNHTYVTTAAPSHFEANTLFLGATDGLFHSNNYGASWLLAVGLMDRSVYKAAPSPFAANVVFAAANNIPDDKEGAKGVFKSEDTGYNFRYTCDLFMVIDQDNPHFLYAATTGAGVLQCQLPLTKLR